MQMPTLACNTKSPWTPRCLSAALEGKWTQPINDQRLTWHVRKTRKKWCWAQITSIYISQRPLLGQAQCDLLRLKNVQNTWNKPSGFLFHWMDSVNQVNCIKWARACSYNGQCTPAAPIGPHTEISLLAKEAASFWMWIWRPPESEFAA